MLPATRGLPFSFRAGRLLASRSPLLPRSPSAINASCQFSSTRLQNAKYVRFEVDPEQPLNYRRWSAGTQVFGGIVVLSVVYYASQYVPSFARVRDASDYVSHTSAVLKLCRRRADGGSWTPARNSRPGYIWITTMSHTTDISSDGEGDSRATPPGFSRQNSPTKSSLNPSGP